MEHRGFVHWIGVQGIDINLELSQGVKSSFDYGKFRVIHQVVPWGAAFSVDCHQALVSVDIALATYGEVDT